MSQDCLDQPLPEPGVALFGGDEHVREIRKSRLVGDNPREADLGILAIEAKHHRMGNRAVQEVEWHTAGPVRAPGEKIVDQWNVETGRVGVDLIKPPTRHAARDYGLGHRD